MSQSHKGMGDRDTIRGKAVMILKIDICMDYGRGTGIVGISSLVI
jgi:hypothetical protein